MSRTLDQIDLALMAVETQLPRINTGLQTTLRQNNLALESGMADLKETVGAPAEDGNAATGLVADIQNLTVLIAALQADVAGLKSKVG